MKLWIEKNKFTDKRLNFIVGKNVHNCFTKFANYFDVEIRKVALKNFEIDIDEVEKSIDRNTFCIVGVVCSTEVGVIDDIRSLNDIALRYDIPLHVDAATGGFYLPFIDREIIFDFRYKGVTSINMSGHKYGLSLPGVGIAILRKDKIPERLYHRIDYLASGVSHHINLLCTQNSLPLVNLYYNIRMLDFTGYKHVMNDLRKKASFLKKKLSGIRNISIAYDSIFPLITITSDNLELLSESLRQLGWIQSVYNVEGTDVRVLRIVIKIGMTYDQLSRIAHDITIFYEELEAAGTTTASHPWFSAARNRFDLQ